LWREESEAVALKATGTTIPLFASLHQSFAPTTGKTRTLQSIMDKIASAAEKSGDAEAVDVSAYPVKRTTR